MQPVLLPPSAGRPPATLHRRAASIRPVLSPVAGELSSRRHERMRSGVWQAGW